jgi:4-hydroxy-3-polyprenylbenzoate decarboxylase
LPIDVPADAEVIVEGFLDPTSAAGNRGALLHATAISHRATPILSAIHPRQPPNELSTIRQAILEIARPLVLASLPDVLDYHLPAIAGCRHAAVVSIRKLRPSQPRQTAGALWAREAWMHARLLVVVDEDADIHDPQDVLGRIVTYADFARDLFIQPGPGSSTLLGIDATRKPSLPKGPATSDAVEELVRSRWAEYGLGEA